MMLDLRTAPLSSRYGAHEQWRKDAGLLWHPADDLPSPRGNPIAAPDDGDVVYSGFGFGSQPGTLGYYTIFDAGDYGLLMAHQDKEYPELLGKKKKGEVIGYSGNTGWSTGPHVHLVMSIKRFPNGRHDFSRENGGTINPRLYFDTKYQSGVLEDMFIGGVPSGEGVWARVSRRVITKSEVSLSGVKSMWYQNQNGEWVAYSPDVPDFVNAKWPNVILAPSSIFVVRK